MPDKPNDFIDQYQAFVREGLQAWSRQFDPQGAAEPSTVAPSADIMGRLFAGLNGYGDWLRSMGSGEPAGMPFGMGGPPPFGQPVPDMPEPGSERYEDWLRVTRDALSMPAFGLTREQQEEQQALFRAAIDYAEQYNRYQVLLRGVQERAAAQLRAQAPATDAESMRSVYDRWVNLAEESYAEAALSEEFREVYAALVNAQMRLKVLQQRQVERAAVQAGMPTRKEVDSLGERLQAVRRELRHMQGLAAEVESLRAEVAALKGGVGAVTAKHASNAPRAKPTTATARSTSAKPAFKKAAAGNDATVAKKSAATARSASAQKPTLKKAVAGKDATAAKHAPPKTTVAVKSVGTGKASVATTKANAATKKIAPSTRRSSSASSRKTKTKGGARR